MASSFDEETETPEMETLASLAENLVYRLPGCADLMIRKTIQEVYRDFCRRSCCLQGRRHFTISYDEPDIVVGPMFGGLIDCIAEITYNRRKLGKRDYVVTGSRISFRDGLIPYDGCDESQLPKIDVLTIEIPKIGSERVPCWFLQKHGEDICAGVLARLQRMTGKAWSDATEAQMNNIVYENAVNEARMRY